MARQTILIVHDDKSRWKCEIASRDCAVLESARFTVLVCSHGYLFSERYPAASSYGVQPRLPLQRAVPSSQQVTSGPTVQSLIRRDLQLWCAAKVTSSASGTQQLAVVEIYSYGVRPRLPLQRAVPSSQQVISGPTVQSLSRRDLQFWCAAKVTSSASGTQQPAGYLWSDCA
ncbi:hypothetical protein J6590_036115, partial [Homalodisca vitripennis]